ncbi:MAG: hypothetical protein ACPHER_08630 [Nevskiales bacterium]
MSAVVTLKNSASLARRGLLFTAVLLGLTSCGGVDEGNKLEGIQINDLSVLGFSDAGIELEETTQSNVAAANAFRCFRSSLVLIGTFRI